MTSLVIVDLDSTVADTTHRHQKTPHQIPDSTWVDYSLLCPDDKPFPGMVRLVQLLALVPGIRIVFLSARSEAAFTPTVEWLRNADLMRGNPVVWLRPDDDPHSPLEWKRIMLYALIADGDEIELLIDDNIRITQMARSLGIPTIPVNMYEDELLNGLHL